MNIWNLFKYNGIKADSIDSAVLSIELRLIDRFEKLIVLKWLIVIPFRFFRMFIHLLSTLYDGLDNIIRGIIGIPLKWILIVCLLLFFNDSIQEGLHDFFFFLKKLFIKLGA